MQVTEEQELQQLREEAAERLASREEEKQPEQPEQPEQPKISTITVETYSAVEPLIFKGDTIFRYALSPLGFEVSYLVDAGENSCSALKVIPLAEIRGITYIFEPLEKSIPVPQMG